MTRMLFILAVLVLSVGCVNVQPVGPMTKVFGDKPLFATKKTTQVKPGDPAALPPAPKPTPPAEIVFPEDVQPEDPQTAARKLMSEYEADRKTMPAPSRTAEISVYKNGQKVQ